jgi:phosphate transport system substrate-binding protein
MPRISSFKEAMGIMKTKDKALIVCPSCKCSTNLSIANYCQQCGQTLTLTINKNRFDRLHGLYRRLHGFRISSVPWLAWLILAALLSVAGYYFVNDKVLQTASPEQAKKEGCIIPGSVKRNSDSYAQICAAMGEILNVPAGQFYYGGTMAAAAMRSPKVISNISKTHPEFRLRYLDPLSVAPDSKTGIQMLIDGKLSFAESQRPLKEDEYMSAKLRDFTLKQVPVAVTGVVFYVNPKMAVSALSLKKLQDIYTGKITNWKTVGGPDQPIVPISQDHTPEGSNLSLLLEGLSPEDRVLGKNVQLVRDNTGAIRKVASTLNAIGYGIQAITVGQSSIRLIDISKGNTDKYVSPATPLGDANTDALEDATYPLIQRVFVVIKQDGTLDELAGTAYANLLLSKEGQKAIQSAGYLPIR